MNTITTPPVNLMEIFPYADEAPLPDTEDVRGW